MPVSSGLSTSPPPASIPIPTPTSGGNGKVVAAGAEVPCAVQTAQDFDTYKRTGNGVTSTTYAADGPLTYKWSADKGTFKNGAVNGQTATWIAPDDITEATSVVIRCTIDDPPGARVSAPDTGSHDDAPTVRSATVIVKAPTVEFTGNELVNQKLRACAGGVDDHAHNDAQYRAHTRQIDLTVKLDGKAMPNAKFTLRFDGNKGHDYGDGREKKMARLHKTSEAFDAAHPWKESLEVQADGAGRVSVWVLSSDVIGKPVLQAILKPVPAPREPVKLGEIGCDFAPPESKRRFGVKDYVAEIDDGWIFNPGLLIPSEEESSEFNQLEVIPAKIYLKLQRDQGKEKDDKYFWIYPNADGESSGERVSNATLDADNDGLIASEERKAGEIRRPLGDDNNWAVVNGHNLRIRIILVINNEDVSVNEEDIANYCTLLDQAGNETLLVDTTTTSDGAAQIRVKSGSLIELAKSIHLEAKDESIFSE